MIKINNNKSYLFNDDYKPCKLYSDGNLIQGWTEKEYSGNPIGISGTYNDLLDITCNGKHSQGENPSPDNPQEIVPVKPTIDISSNLLDLNKAILSDCIAVSRNSVRTVMPNRYYASINISDNLDFIKRLFNNGHSMIFHSDTVVIGRNRTIVIYGTFNNSSRTNVELSASERDLIFNISWLIRTYGINEITSINRIELRVNRVGTPITDTTTIYEGLRFYMGADAGDSLYRTPREIITDYELYGADGVYDTLEPCVLIDGEYKCRVTRRWKKDVFNRFSGTLSGSEKAFVVYISINGSYKASDSLLCDKLKLTNRTYQDMDVYTINDVNGVTETKCVALPLSIKSLAEANEWIANNPLTIVYRLREPIIGLYPPIMINGMPYGTVINGNTDMLVKAKVMD